MPLGNAHAPAYAAFMPLDQAERETAEAEAHWSAHGFGPWAVLEAERFVGCAEVHFAGVGIEGIAPDEVEIGWMIVEERRGCGLATEAMRVVIADAWHRTHAPHLVAYIRPENAISQRVAEKLGLRARGTGLTRSRDPMTVFELRHD